MLPIIRAVATAASDATKQQVKGIVQEQVKDNARERLSAMAEKRSANAERVKGIYNKLKDGNASAHAAAIAMNNESTFEPRALALLGSIDSNMQELLSKFNDDKKPSGLLSGLLGGLSMLMMPLVGKIGKGLSLLASPFKMIAKGLSFIGSSLLKLLKFFKIGSLARGAGRVAGGAASAIGRGAARMGGAIGLGAIAGRLGSVAGIRTLGAGAARMGSKLIPGVGLALGAGFAANRASKGDYIGALGEAVSGIASTVPGVGTAAALAIQAGLVARDMSKKANKESEQTIRSTRKGIDAVNNNSISSTQQQKKSFDSFTTNLSDMTTKTKEKLLSGTDKMLTSIKDFMPKMFTNIGGGITSMLKTLGDFGPKILDTIKASVAAVVLFASSPLTAAINKIKSLLPDWMGGPADDIPRSNATPSAAARQNFGKVKDELKSAAGKFGVDAGLLAKIAYFESGKSFSTTAAPISSKASNNTVYNKGAGRNAISSAHGLGQFIDSTWYSTLSKHGGAMGIGTNLSQREMDALRRSPRVQALALAAHTKENMALSAQFSGGDKGADVYAMHNLGSGSGAKFLRQLRTNPNANIGSVLSAKEIRNNPALYDNGNVTVQQAYNKMRGHIADGEEFATSMNGGTFMQKAKGVATIVSPASILKSVGTNSSNKPSVGNSFAPTQTNTSDEFDFSNLGSDYKVPKMGFLDSLKSVFTPSSNDLSSNVASKKRTNKEIADALEINKNSPRSAGTVMTGGMSVLKNAPKILGKVPQVIKSIPSAVSGVYSVVTGKQNTKPATSRAPSKTTDKGSITDMGGAGVMSKGRQTQASAATYKTDMGAINYSTPVMDGDKIAAAAEGMVGNQLRTDFGLCVRAVWFILGRAGIAGFPTTKSASNDARKWGSSGIAMAKQAPAALVQRGFREIAAQGAPQNGDVDVLGPAKAKGNSHAGHIQVYANGKWYSDHKQGRRYTLDTYTWVKTFRYGAGGSAGTVAGANSEPTMPSPAPEMSMSDKIAHMMTSVFTSDNLDGLREFIKGGELDKFEKTTPRASTLGEYTGTNESVLTDFGFGENKNGTMSDNLKRVLGGSKERQNADSTGIRNTTGFTKNTDRQLGDITGIRDTTGFTKNPDRQLGDTTGIDGTPGFGGSGGIRQNSSKSSGKKQKWWERLFGGSFGSILEGAIPGFGAIFGMIQKKDYTGILEAVTGKNTDGGIIGRDDDFGMGGIDNIGGVGTSSINKILGNIKNKNYGQLITDILPSTDFMNEGLGQMTASHFDNKLKMQNQQSQASIITPPAQSNTVSAGSSDGAVIPISVRNNDSIIREIAKEYLKSSM